jgi:hypothetical protein
MALSHPYTALETLDERIVNEQVARASRHGEARLLRVQLWSHRRSRTK